MIFRSPPERTGPDRPTSQGAGLAAVADVLLSASAPPPSPPVDDPAGRAPAEASPAAPAPPVVDRGAPEPPVPEADPPRGLYVLVPAGIEPSARREAALSAAGRLAARQRLAGVLFLEAGRVDAHVLGEAGCGRLGPQNYLGGADVDQSVRRLADHCDSVALVPLDCPGAVLDRPRPAVDRPVFLIEPDAEGLVEAYRVLKAWRQAGAAGHSAVLFAGRRQARAEPFHARLRHAARAFLGCDLARQREGNGEAGTGAGGGAPAVRLFAGAPAEAVWGPLLVAAAGPAAMGTVDAPAKPLGPEPQPDAYPATRSAFALWQPESRDALLDVAEAQLPDLLGDGVRHVFRVDVAEPGAPPLVAVRDDGTLVAILFGEPDEYVPSGPARAWLRVHWPLLMRVRPDAGLGGEPKVGTMVLAASRPAQAGDKVRRFVPVRLGARKGLVLLP